MDVSEYIGAVSDEGERFARAAEAGSLAVEIPPCPGWTMRDLVRHLGFIHLWAAENVTHPIDDWADVDDLPDLTAHWPELATAWPDDADLVAWYRRTNANLVRVLESAPPDLECFAFLPAPTPLTMWSRRQASEIAIHRFDAEVAHGVVSQFDEAFAADMLDELLAGFAPRPGKVAVDDTRTIHVHASDVDEHWCLTLEPHGITTSRMVGDADLTVRATATELYLAFWNRTADTTLELDGDAGLMDTWRQTCRVRWG